MTEPFDPLDALTDSVRRAGSSTTMTADERERVHASMLAAYREMALTSATPVLQAEPLPLEPHPERHIDATVDSRRRPRRSWFAAVAAVTAMVVVGGSALALVARPNRSTPASPVEYQPLPIRDDGEIRRWRIPIGDGIVEFDTTSAATLTDVGPYSFSIIREQRSSPDPTGLRVDIAIVTTVFDGQSPQDWADANAVEGVSLRSDPDGPVTSAWQLFIPSARSAELGCLTFEPCIATATTPDGADALRLRATSVNELRLIEVPDNPTPLAVVTDRLSHVVGSSSILAEVDRDLFISTFVITPA